MRTFFILLISLVFLSGCESSSTKSTSEQKIFDRMYELAQDLKSQRSGQAFVVRHYPDEGHSYVAVRAAQPDTGYVVLAESHDMPGAIIKTPNRDFVMEDLDLARLSQSPLVPAKALLLIRQYRSTDAERKVS